jgi:MinD-like ATPase involved in chromosome partitioning or flagellar assembly
MDRMIEQLAARYPVTLAGHDSEIAKSFVEVAQEIAGASEEIQEIS